MSLRHPIRASSAARSGAALLFAVVALAAVAACGSSSGPSAQEAAGAAAGAVSEAFRLPDDTRACLIDHFQEQGSARTAMTTTDEPTADEQEALGAVVKDCASDEQVADGIATSISAALPPADTSGAAAQTSCLRTSVLDLEPGEMRTLVVGLLMLGAPLEGELATARNDLVNSLYGGCGVEVGS